MFSLLTDTWTAYVNTSNNALIEAVDWVGTDAYPYFQTTDANNVDNAPGLFFDAYQATVGAAMGKPVWVTETGWPVTGAQSGQATAGTANAEIYWKGVACKLLGSVNTWWYQLNDGADQATSFKVIPANRGAPLYDLSCPASSSSVSSAAARTSTSVPSSAASSAATSSAVLITASGTTIVVPTGTPSGRPSIVSGSAANSTAINAGSPNDNNQNAGTIASQSAATAAGTGSSSPAGTGVTPASSATTSTPAAYTGAAVVNAPAVGLLLVGAIMGAL